MTLIKNLNYIQISPFPFIIIIINKRLYFNKIIIIITTTMDKIQATSFEVNS